MSEQLPPPTYSQQDPDDTSSETTESSAGPSQPQLLIVPTVDTVNFQKGFLGAADERAAIEGELQIKGAVSEAWDKVTVNLKTIETAYSKEIELGMSEVVLWSRSANPSVTTLPSSLLFAIPLMPDAPQSIITPHSLNIHTKRFMSHLYYVPISPETYSLEQPVSVHVQVPRVIYQVGEPIPVYITIPSPPRQIVVEDRLRLRNVKTEVVQTVTVKRDNEDVVATHSAVIDSTSVALPPAPEKFSYSSKSPISPLPDCTFRSVLARSGASCRFHSSLPVKLRFIMHQASPFSSPTNNISNLPRPEYEQLDGDTEYASITQFTLLHSVTFQINVHVSFVNVDSRTERISTISIPIKLLPPSASLPEVGISTDEAYQKKHDRPPVQTNRYEDDFAPHYSEGEAGPSGLPHGAPPPFEERDAPPPFFSSAAEASTSARLPTFLESESEIIIPPDSDQTFLPQTMQVVDGEGTLFGFNASQVFDGHSDDMQRSSTPPPTLEMASRDTDVTQLADMTQPERAIEALGLVLTAQAQRENDASEPPPPPPPALDDPSDPPPSIDSDFRSPDQQPRQRSPPIEVSGLHTPSPAPPENLATHGHAPPPYLVPDNHVTRPPPYMD
ncbi:hypothetical protein BDP27DRAFT_1383765 [Rhodocollybia butyracea]|uniref:Uncharacterized protein n=1 Tax=Rhodocollybia butyracea TaxID=206335 RepID=A0A9P5PQC0_9AGAR|nr:hypothetical protein BDP27DRAFT_1383765 [Rhodocollybia butyracea]